MTYSIELNLANYEIIREDGRWAQAEVLVAEGNSFEELLDNAELFFVDQDGGEAFSCPFDGSYMTSKIYDLVYLELARHYHNQMVRIMNNQGWNL